MMMLFTRLVVLLIAVTCLGSIPERAESKTGSTRMVEVGDGVSLRVIEAGKSGDGPVLVFIPGWSTGADIWHRQIDTFAKKHRVIAFDPRSEGESTKTTSGNTPEIRAQDLHALLERLGVRRPVLIGWSQGVQDIATYVERYGTKELAGIVLVDAAISDGADGMAAQYWLLTEGLGVNHAHVVMGTSMGEMPTWLWSELHLDFMDVLMPLASLPTQISGRNRAWRRITIDAIRNDPAWNGGD